MSDMDNLVRNLRILARTDLIIAEIHFRRVMKKSGFFAFALLVGVFGVIMLGVAGFLALEEIYGAKLAAAITGGAGVVLALLLAFIGMRVRSGDELGLANEVHGAAMAAVSRDLKSAGSNVSQIAAFVRNPLDAALPGMAMQVFGLVMKMLRRRKNRSGEE
ncbi:phage holin family protein [Xanthobacter sp. TB0139]|uniref:phage holin family protein n=1 Tax=Xanthobacter sp. TB0139 TaxID=3459178 RepID=UPI004039E27F